MRKVLVIVGILLAFCCASRADDIFQVNGILTIVGNNACPPLPACAETLNFSFSVDEGPDTMDVPEGAYQLFTVAGSGSIESLGPLGQFSVPFTMIGNPAFTDSGDGDNNYVAFTDADDDEIDIHFFQGVGNSLFTPSVVTADLYGCGTATCTNEFSPFAGGSATAGEIGIFDFGEVSATVTPVPEISSASLLAVGLLALVGLGIVRRRAKHPVAA